VKHKIDWIDRILNDFRNDHIDVQSKEASLPKLVFISHSIGAHLVQCLLLERHDILQRAKLIMHLMPFFRFDPPFIKKAILSTLAHNQRITIPTMTGIVRFASSRVSRKLLDKCMEKIAGVECSTGRKIAMDIFMNHTMVSNHLVLGTQEVRGEIKSMYAIFFCIWRY
jgi:hypothetical protein